MKNFLVGIIEGLTVGVLIALLLFVIGVETEVWQIMIIAGGVVIITSIASALARAITKGGLLYNYEWAIQYNEHSIIVKAANAEELYINGKLVDKKTGAAKSVELNGSLESGEKVKVIISPKTFGEMVSHDRMVKCEVFVDDKPLQMAVA